MLNEGQQKALEQVLEGKSVLITGPGGTGKSFLIKTINEELTKRGKKVAVTALTGCAALLLGPQAKTIHSWAGIGLGREPAKKIAADIRKLRYKKKINTRWLLTTSIIIDEVSMMTPEIFELLNDVATQVRRDTKLFGGIQIILVGDFFQLPPVVKKEDGEEQRFLFESSLWKTFNPTICHLKEVVRQKDPVFQEILNEARIGKVSNNLLNTLMDRQNASWDSLKVKPTLLFSRRAEVEMINERNMRALPGKAQTFEVKTVYDSTTVKGLDEKSPEVVFAISKLDRDAPYKCNLSLKIGTQVMLIYNLDQEAGLVNGSRGVVEGFTETVPSLPIVFFKEINTKMPVGHCCWESEEIEGLKRSQIPLIPAWAVTIHKCQGATLDSALIDIGASTFEVGQAYVALSRVKSLDSLYIYDLDPNAFKAHPKVIEFYNNYV
jgi:ATP-dependent DNA helicase PIF1